MERPGPRRRKGPQRPSPGRLLRADSAAADYDVTTQGDVLLGPAPPTRKVPTAGLRKALGANLLSWEPGSYPE